MVEFRARAGREGGEGKGKKVGDYQRSMGEESLRERSRVRLLMHLGGECKVIKWGGAATEGRDTDTSG